MRSCSQFEQVNTHMLEFFNEVLPDITNKTPGLPEEAIGNVEALLGNTHATRIALLERRKGKKILRLVKWMKVSSNLYMT